MMRNLLLAATAFASIAVAGAVSTAPAEAQGNMCLRNNRIWSWDTINSNTMVVTDRQRNRYMVRLSGGCFGLQENLLRVNFRTTMRLGCLRPGDRVEYRVPGWGRESCFIRAVQPINNRPLYGRDTPAYPWSEYW
jgi:hypothetical protein